MSITGNGRLPADRTNVARSGRGSGVAVAGGLLARYALPAGEIERVSLGRIEARLRAGGTDPLTGLPPADRHLALRLIYAAGDPALAPAICIHPEAVAAGVAALRRGAAIITDVRMAAAGISRPLADSQNCAILAAIAEAEPEPGAASGMSRTAAGLDRLLDRLTGAVVAVGNAPTALLRLLDLTDAGAARPAVILGLPVGFVAAAEAKDELTRREVPYVTVLGTRGGSGLAAAAVNTLLRLAANEASR